MSKPLAFAIFVITTAVHAQTLTLDEAIRRAVATAPELRALEASVAEARANAILGDAFHSAATVSTTPGFATGLPTAVLGQVPAIATVEAHRLMYDRSARAEAIASATQVDAAMARLESARREVALNTANLYASVAAGPAHVAAAHQRIRANETIVARTEALRGEGRVRDIDIDRARLDLATAQNALAKAQSRLDLDRARLAGLVGGEFNVEPADLGRSAGPADPSRSTELDAATPVDPELASFDARIEALQRAANLQKSRFQPTIAGQIQYSRLFDRYHRYYLNFKPDDLSAGATVTLPIFTGGSRTATSARLAAQIDQLKAERDARRSAMVSEEREAAAELALATAERQLAERARSIALESLRIAQDLAREGRGEPNDVPAAEIAVADAEDDVGNATVRELTTRTRLLILHGAFRVGLITERK